MTSPAPQASDVPPRRAGYEILGDRIARLKNMQQVNALASRANMRSRQGQAQPDPQHTSSVPDLSSATTEAPNTSASEKSSSSSVKANYLGNYDEAHVVGTVSAQYDQMQDENLMASKKNLSSYLPSTAPPAANVPSSSRIGDGDTNRSNDDDQSDTGFQSRASTARARGELVARFIRETQQEKNIDVGNKQAAAAPPPAAKTNQPLNNYSVTPPPSTYNASHQHAVTTTPAVNVATTSATRHYNRLAATAAPVMMSTSTVYGSRQNQQLPSRNNSVTRTRPGVLVPERQVVTAGGSSGAAASPNKAPGTKQLAGGTSAGAYYHGSAGGASAKQTNLRGSYTRTTSNQNFSSASTSQPAASRAEFGFAKAKLQQKQAMLQKQLLLSGTPSSHDSNHWNELEPEVDSGARTPFSDFEDNCVGGGGTIAGHGQDDAGTTLPLDGRREEGATAMTNFASSTVTWSSNFLGNATAWVDSWKQQVADVFESTSSAAHKGTSGGSAGAKTSSPAAFSSKRAKPSESQALLQTPAQQRRGDFYTEEPQGTAGAASSGGQRSKMKQHQKTSGANSMNYQFFYGSAAVPASSEKSLILSPQPVVEDHAAFGLSSAKRPRPKPSSSTTKRKNLLSAAPTSDDEADDLHIFEQALKLSESKTKMQIRAVGFTLFILISYLVLAHSALYYPSSSSSTADHGTQPVVDGATFPCPHIVFGSYRFGPGCELFWSRVFNGLGGGRTIAPTSPSAKEKKQLLRREANSKSSDGATKKAPQQEPSLYPEDSLFVRKSHSNLEDLNEESSSSSSSSASKDGGIDLDSSKEMTEAATTTTLTATTTFIAKILDSVLTGGALSSLTNSLTGRSSSSGFLPNGLTTTVEQQQFKKQIFQGLTDLESSLAFYSSEQLSDDALKFSGVVAHFVKDRARMGNEVKQMLKKFPEYTGLDKPSEINLVYSSDDEKLAVVVDSHGNEVAGSTATSPGTPAVIQELPPSAPGAMSGELGSGPVIGYYGSSTTPSSAIPEGTPAAIQDPLLSEQKDQKRVYLAIERFAPAIHHWLRHLQNNMILKVQVVVSPGDHVWLLPSNRRRNANSLAGDIFQGPEQFSLLTPFFGTGTLNVAGQLEALTEGSVAGADLSVPYQLQGKGVAWLIVDLLSDNVVKYHETTSNRGLLKAANDAVARIQKVRRTTFPEKVEAAFDLYFNLWTGRAASRILSRTTEENTSTIKQQDLHSLPAALFRTTLESEFYDATSSSDQDLLSNLKPTIDPPTPKWMFDQPAAVSTSGSTSTAASSHSLLPFAMQKVYVVFEEPIVSSVVARVMRPAAAGSPDDVVSVGGTGRASTMNPTCVVDRVRSSFSPLRLTLRSHLSQVSSLEGALSRIIRDQSSDDSMAALVLHPEYLTPKVWRKITEALKQTPNTATPTAASATASTAAKSADDKDVVSSDSAKPDDTTTSADTKTAAATETSATAPVFTDLVAFETLKATSHASEKAEISAFVEIRAADSTPAVATSAAAEKIVERSITDFPIFLNAKTAGEVLNKITLLNEFDGNFEAFLLHALGQSRLTKYKLPGLPAKEMPGCV
ncbi:unnamed protein product [Amoebophrya sp. A120]|nr:unnamed protein product [Amoebophrya sp. A120]|eukprot:GSA120T00007733001.1